MPSELRRSSRRAGYGWRVPVLAALAIVAIACGGDSSTGPNASAAGSYALATFNGKGLPATVFADTGFTLVLARGTLSLGGDGNFQAIFVTNETVEAHLSVYTDTSTGRWTQTGGTVVFVGPDSSRLSGAWDGERLTLRDTTTIPTSTYVFSRQ